MVQAPHCPTPQPNLVPTKSRLSRSTQSIGVSGATSTVRDWPFTLSVYFIAFDGFEASAIRVNRSRRDRRRNGSRTDGGEIKTGFGTNEVGRGVGPKIGH